MRRLRRPTGPNRAAMRAVSYKILLPRPYGYRRDLLQHKILDFGRYWRRHCAHLGRFRDFARDFPRAVDEQLRTR